MIHFDPVPEPLDYAAARQAGLQWLQEHPDANRPRDYWSQFKPQLAAGFRWLCAYSAMFEPVGTVDHFVSWKHDRTLAYQWTNFRYASAWINSSKQTADDTVLDPFEVEDGWFEIALPSLELRLTDRVPANQRAKAEYTLRRLHLRDDERVLNQRAEWHRMYREGELTLDGLRAKAPLIARAVERASACDSSLTHATVRAESAPL